MDLIYAVQNLKAKYPDVIFVNDGMNYENIERIKTEFQCDLLAEMSANDVPYSKMLLVDKKTQEFFKTNEFKEAAKLDYFDRKLDTTLSKGKEAILKELTKNKIKVSP